LIDFRIGAGILSGFIFEDESVAPAREENYPNTLRNTGMRRQIELYFI